MIRLQNMSIKARLTAALIIVLLLLVAVGVVVTFQLENQARLTNELYQHPLQVSNAALRASLGVWKMNLYMEDLTSPAPRLTEEEARTALRHEERIVFENLDVVRARVLRDRGQELERETRTLFEAWKPIRQETLRLTTPGDREGAAAFRAARAEPHIEKLESKLMELNAFARRTADGFMEEARDAQVRARTTVVILVSAAAVLTALLMLLLLRSIATSMASLQGTMSQIATTGEFAQADVIGQHEVTEMTRHFNSLIRVLHKQFWLREGLNSLNKELSASNTYDDVLARSIRFVSRYTDACTGALYARNDDRDRCELRASFAFVEREHLANAFEMGEGIVGQVAVEKQPILLKNIRRSEAEGQSGTVSEPARCIYAIPLAYEDELQGVLEVASFESIGDDKREFLDAAGGVIATAMYTLAQSSKIEQLLRVAQATNEALETKSRELNAANQQMVASNEELQSQAHELEAQAEELRAQATELESQQVQLQESDRLKSEFLSNMSHELRTPLNSVLALSQLMISRGVGKDPSQEAEYLRVIERNGRQLLALINDILDLSKIESGRMDVVTTEFDPRELAEAVLETVQPIARTKSLTTSLEADGPIRLRSDEEKVRQIVLNLVSNAVKFTDDGSVHVRVYEQDGRVRFEVRDTGIGISKENQRHVFDEFRQVDGSTTRRHEGTGLGLAICNKLAVLLGGSIDVESEPGVGSTFTLSVPSGFGVPTPSMAPPPAAPAADARPVQRATGPHRVLVIDDEKEAREALREHLEGAGYQVLAAADGEEGLALARRHRPSAITLDLVMPGMDGWEVITRLKAMPETVDIPVLIVSVSEDRATSEALGASGYIKKPRGLGDADRASQPDRTTALARLDKALAEAVSGHRKSSPPTPSPSSSLAPCTERSWVMVVEDSPTAILQIRSALEDVGCDVEVASGGQEAIDRLASDMPRALVLDLMMPEVDGFGVLERIRAMPRTASLPVLVLTAKELTTEDRALLRKYGVQEVAQKGSTQRDELVAKILRVADVERRRQPEQPLTEPVRSSHVTKRPVGAMVLVVEDNPDNRFTLSAVLDDLECPHEMAADGPQAMEIARRLQPGLILMDVQLPGMSGVDVTREIKNDPKLAHVPVVALTAKAMKGDREAILAAGCDDYLAKPVDPDSLAAMIRKWTG